MKNIYIYIAIMAIVTFLIRAIPLTFIRKEIDNKFIKSFLYYVPFVALAVMTFPGILSSTESLCSAIMGFIVALVLAYFDKGLFWVSVSSCAAVFITELII